MLTKDLVIGLVVVVVLLLLAALAVLIVLGSGGGETTQRVDEYLEARDMRKAGKG
jgi:flagellar basal body-associated protein FliL